MSEFAKRNDGVQDTVDFSEIIGGARDPRTGRIVPIHWIKIFRNDEKGYTLYEGHALVDDATIVVGTSVDANRETRCWEFIKVGYAEMTVPQSGNGAIHTWIDRDGVFGEHVRHEVTSGEQPHLLIGTDAPFLIEAGDLGMTVLSFCQGIPFGEVSEMERVVETPAIV